MGDYRTNTAVGIVIDPDDFFFETREVTKVLCDYPEAGKNKFCPVCGLSKKKRTRVTKIRSVKSAYTAFIDIEDFEDIEEAFEWDNLRIGELRVVLIKWDPYNKHTYVLGNEIGTVSTYDSYDVVQEDACVTETTIATTRRALQKLGITDEPKVFLSLCYA